MLRSARSRQGVPLPKLSLLDQLSLNREARKGREEKPLKNLRTLRAFAVKFVFDCF
jgi:hypothetical protein